MVGVPLFFLMAGWTFSANALSTVELDEYRNEKRAENQHNRRRHGRRQSYRSHRPAPSFAKSSYEYHKCVLYTFPSEGINDFIHPHSMGTLEENRISRS